MVRDPASEQDDLRRRLQAALDGLRAAGFRQWQISQAGHRSYTAIYRQAAGGQVDPLVVDALEGALRQIQRDRRRSQNSRVGVRIVMVVGETGASGRLYERPREITVPDDVLTRGADHAAVTIGEDDDDLGLRAGESVVYESGALPVAGEVAVVEIDGRPVLRRCRDDYRENGTAVLGVARHVVTMRSL